MKQSRAMSLVESIINIVIGFGMSLLAQWFFLPLLGVHIDFAQNLEFALIMTAVSIARQFLLRRLFEALHIRRPLSPFMEAVIEERYRQIRVEGWSTAHDDAHLPGELSRAGACYGLRAGSPNPEPPPQWPWEREWWKPHGFRRDLVVAGALNFAEGEKFDRNRKRRDQKPVPAADVEIHRPPTKYERLGSSYNCALAHGKNSAKLHRVMAARILFSPIVWNSSS